MFGQLVTVGPDHIKQATCLILLALMDGTTNGIMPGFVGIREQLLVLRITPPRLIQPTNSPLLVGYFLGTIPDNLSILWWTFGATIMTATLVGLAYAPPALTGTGLGIL